MTKSTFRNALAQLNSTAGAGRAATELANTTKKVAIRGPLSVTHSRLLADYSAFARTQRRTSPASQHAHVTARAVLTWRFHEWDTARRTEPRLRPRAENSAFAPHANASTVAIRLPSDTVKNFTTLKSTYQFMAVNVRPRGQAEFIADPDAQSDLGGDATRNFRCVTFLFIQPPAVRLAKNVATVARRIGFEFYLIPSPHNRGPIW